MAKTILVPLDGSELSTYALEPAAELAAKLPANLLLLRVIEPTEYPLPLAYPGVPGAMEEKITDPVRRRDLRAELDAAQERLEAVAAPLRATGITVKVEALPGSPASTIAMVATDEHVDMIAMATHGRGGLARLVMGSVAEAVLHRVHVPLLLVRPETMHARQ
jgi:nucleotide-binding universal stress UspA family protein